MSQMQVKLSVTECIICMGNETDTHVSRVSHVSQVSHLSWGVTPVLGCDTCPGVSYLSRVWLLSQDVTTVMGCDTCPGCRMCPGCRTCPGCGTCTGPELCQVSISSCCRFCLVLLRKCVVHSSGSFRFPAQFYFSPSVHQADDAAAH